MAIIIAPRLRDISIGTVIVLSGLLLFINGWIVVDVEGMLPRLAQDDDISYILRKDVGRVVGIQGLVLMLLVLHMQQYQERVVMASSFVMAYTFTNMLVFGVDSATLILFVIPAVSLLVLLLDASAHPDPPLEVWKGYRELDESTPLKGCAKASLIMYCLVVAMQIFLVGSSLLYPFHTFYFDNYDIESPEAMDARRLEIQAHAWFIGRFGIVLARTGSIYLLDSGIWLSFDNRARAYWIPRVDGNRCVNRIAARLDCRLVVLCRFLDFGDDWVRFVPLGGEVKICWSFSTEGTTAEQQHLLVA